MALINRLGLDRYTGTFDLDGQIKLREQSPAPSTPEANSLSVYAKDQAGVSALFYKNDAGVEINLSGGLTGTGANGQLALWTGTTTLAGSSRLIYGSGVNPNIQVLSLDAAQFAQLAVGRATADIRIAVAGGAGQFSDIAVQGDGIVREDTSNLILTARNATGTIKFATGAADTEKFRIGSAGQLGIGGATFGTSGNLLRSNGSAAAVSWQDHTADFLSQYALLAGRSGGQTVKGGTGASENLILQATDHATQGSVKFNSPSTTLTIRHDVATAGDIRHVYSVGGTDLWDSFWNASGYQVRDIAGGFKSPFTFQAGCPNGAFVIGPAGVTVLGKLGIGGAPDATIETLMQVNRNVTSILAGSFKIQNTSATNGSAMVNLEGASGGTAGFSFTVGTAHFDFSGVNNCASFAIRDTGFNQIIRIDQGAGASAFVVDSSGNIGIGGSSFPSTGTKGLVFAAGTALATMAAGSAGLYAQTVSGVTHLIAIASDGTTVQLV